MRAVRISDREVTSGDKEEKERWKKENWVKGK